MPPRNPARQTKPVSHSDVGAFRLYVRYVAISWRAQLQYRASFLLQCLGTGMITAGEFLVIVALFGRFKTLGGWTLPEICVFYGTVNLAWSIAEALARGFDDFGSLVKSGDFDRILLRPRSTVLQVLGREFTLRRVGRFALGVMVLTWGWTDLELGWDGARLLLVGFAVAGGVALFIGLLVLQATLAFWTVESLEVMNILTYGGVTTTQYPITIYPSRLRHFFTAVIPLACVAYFPIVAVLGHPDPLGTAVVWQCLSPTVGFLFFGLSLLVWRMGVRHYSSTGS